MSAYSMKYSMLNKELTIAQDGTDYEFRITEANRTIYMNGISGYYSAFRGGRLIPRYTISKSGQYLAMLTSSLIMPGYGVDFTDGTHGSIRVGTFFGGGHLTYQSQRCGRLLMKHFNWLLELDDMDTHEDFLFVSAIVAMLKSRE